jgi:hypothetical protein
MRCAMHKVVGWVSCSPEIPSKLIENDRLVKFDATHKNYIPHSTNKQPGRLPDKTFNPAIEYEFAKILLKKASAACDTHGQSPITTVRPTMRWRKFRP